MRTFLILVMFCPVLFLSACAGSNDSGPDIQLEQSDSVSACGGFSQDGSPLFADPLPYCEAEQLHWQYDSQSLTLKLADARVLLNCCGEHTMSAQFEDTTLVVTEVDAPEFSDARCGCMCVFDYTITLSGIEPGLLPVRLMRHVTDQSSGPEQVWQGQLDLGQGAGVLTLSTEDVGMWCGEGV